MVIVSMQAMAQGSNDAAISNILNTMPAQNAIQLGKSMDAITALGEKGITDLATWLKDKGDNTAVEYALGGYTYYVTQPGRQALRVTAVKAYVAALDKVQGNTNKQFIIKQLQQMGTDDAVPVLAKYLGDEALAGAAARALQGINTPLAKKALLNTNATNVVMFKPADTSGIQYKTAALYKLVKQNGEAALPALRKAMLDENAQYRQAALWYADKYRGTVSNRQWLALMPTISPEAQVQVINFVADSKDKLNLPIFFALLKDNNRQVRLAAIAASGKVGNEVALPRLLKLMKVGDTTEINAARDAILMMKGDGVVATVTNAFTDDMPPAAQVALIEVLAARRASQSMYRILAEVKSADNRVHAAAIKALPALVSGKDLKDIVALLNAAPAADVTYLQKTVINLLSEEKDTAKKVLGIAYIMNEEPAKKYLYLNVLASIGGRNALALIQSAYDNGDAQTKHAAIGALSTSKEMKAARMLLKMAQTDVTFQHDAVSGYINVIEQGAFPADEKLIMLKEAMAVATTDDHRKDIMEQVGECNTFLAMIFAGQYLDNAAVQRNAAQAVASIAINHNEFNGELVKGLLTKAAAVLNSQDDDYTRKAIAHKLESMPAGTGFVSMFNGKDLSGWKGLVENPIARAKMPADTLKAKQIEADKVMNAGWFVKDGYLVFSGHGENLCTVQQYADFDMYVDWKIGPQGDAGIYLRGSPQVQIWDTSRRNVGAEVGSGGLYNNAKYQSKPLVLADNAINEWNSFHIIMRDDKVTVYLNGVLVTDNVTLENYWDRKIPIFPKEQIELQAHGNVIYYRDLYIKELGKDDPVALSSEERKDGFTSLFNGTNLNQWTGDKSAYKIVDDGSIMVDTAVGNPGNLYTADELSNFVLRFQFKLTPGANNGIGIRAPLEGDAAYVGMEIQVLDNEAPKYKDLHVYQYHGSVYGVIPAKRGFLKPTGEWNDEEIVANGSHIKVTLNGEVILDGDINEASKNGTADHREHPGLKRATGHIGFLGHGDVVYFKNVRVKALNP